MSSIHPINADTSTNFDASFHPVVSRISFLLAMLISIGILGAVSQAQSAYMTGSVSWLEPTTKSTNGYLDSPQAVAVDQYGNLYIADTYNSRIIKESPSSSSGYTEYVLATNANSTHGIAVDSNQNVFYCTYTTTSPGGACYELPYTGSGSTGYGSAITVQIHTTSGGDKKGMVVDPNGNLYIADYTLGGVLEETPTSGSFATTTETLLYGGNSNFSLDDSDFAHAYGTGAFDPINGNWFIPTESTSGYIAEGTTPVGTAPVTSYTLTHPLSSGLYTPTATYVDTNHDLFIFDSGASGGQTRILEYTCGTTCSNSTPTWTQHVIATGGSGSLTGFGVDPSGTLYYPGNYPAATFTAPAQTYVITKFNLGEVNFGSVAVGSSATQYVNFVFTSTSTLSATTPVTVTTPQGTASTQFVPAPSATVSFYSEATTPVLENYTPSTCVASAVFTATAGQIYSCVIAVTFTPAQTGVQKAAVNLVSSSGAILGTGYISGIGVAPQAIFLPGTEKSVATSTTAAGIAVDASGNVYAALPGATSINRYAYTAGSFGTATAIGSGFGTPTATAVDGNGNLYVIDSKNNNLYIETYSGSSYAQTTFGSAAITNEALSSPSAVAVDRYGDIFIADTGNNRVLGEYANSVNGYTEESITVASPKGIAVDQSGDIFISSGNTVLEETPTVNAYNVTETYPVPSYAQVTVSTSTLSSPSQLAVDGAGNLYIADTGNHRILEETLSASTPVESTVTVSTSTNSLVPAGIAVAPNGNIVVADSANNRIVTEDVVDTPTLTFAALPNTSSAQQTVRLANDGNAPLSITIPGSGSNPSVPTGYSLYSSGGSDCPLIPSSANSAGTVAVGTSCLLPITFTPTSFGTNNATLTVTDNSDVSSSNTVTQSISLSGASYYTTSTALTTSTTSVVPGQAVTLTAAVSGTGGTTPTGTVTFTATSTGANQGVLGTTTLVNGVASYYGLVWAGTDTITAIYNGNSSYSASTSSAVTVTNASVSGTLQFNWTGLNWAQGVSYGTSTPPWPVTLQNLTGVTVTPTIGIANSNFVISGSTCGTLTQGATCIFYVTFTPTSGGSVTGTQITSVLTATTSTPAQDASIPVSGIALSSALTFNWPALHFAPAVSLGGVSAPWPVTLHNQSGATTLSNPAMSFTDSSFSVTNDTCSGQTLAASANCTFSVVFSPIAADMSLTSVSATMTVTGNSNGTLTSTLPLSGLINQAPLTLNWQSVNFQPQTAGISTTNPWPVTVTNNSGLTLSSLSYTFTNVANYQTGGFALSNTCSTLAGGASCTFNIVSSPQTTQPIGAYSATLVVSGTGSDGVFSTAALPISGTSLANGFAINWNQDQQSGVSTIDFGPQNTMNVTAGPWPITVFNNTPNAQTLTITPSLSQFTISSSNNTCSGSVPAGGSCIFGLNFTPPADQSYQGTLTLAAGPYSCYFNTWGSANK